jgi:alcohol dehydrogenase
MKQATAAVFAGESGAMELRQIPLPTPDAGEILVRILGCTLCGSDLHSFEGRRKCVVPTVLGHEMIGEIAAFSSGKACHDLNHEPLQIGDRVSWAIVASCGECFYCLRNLPQKCVHGVKYGHEHFSERKSLTGGLADFCLLAPGTACVKIAQSLPLEVACPANCATATVVAALEGVGDLRDRVISVWGAGLLGLTACAMCEVLGAQTIISVDPSSTRQALAKNFGATHAISPDQLSDCVSEVTKNRGIDLALDFSGATAAFEQAWSQMRMGGEIVLVGAVFPGEPAKLALEQLVRRQLKIRGIHNYAPQHLRAAVQFLTIHHTRYPFEKLVTQWFPLSQIATAFQAAASPAAIRVGVRFE